MSTLRQQQPVEASPLATPPHQCATAQPVPVLEPCAHTCTTAHRAALPEAMQQVAAGVVAGAAGVGAEAVLQPPIACVWTLAQETCLLAPAGQVDWLIKDRDPQSQVPAAGCNTSTWYHAMSERANFQNKRNGAGNPAVTAINSA
jgi:hypothetical protein